MERNGCSHERSLGKLAKGANQFELDRRWPARSRLRHADAPELQESDLLYAEALLRAGCIVRHAPSDGDQSAFEEADAVVLRSTWGYYPAAGKYCSWMKSVAS